MAKDKAYTKRTDDTGNDAPQSTSYAQGNDDGLLFGRKNYMFILIGIGLIFLGLVLMSGGQMPSPDVWDESLIYSFRRITLAPMVILAGIGVEIYAIFVRK